MYTVCSFAHLAQQTASYKGLSFIRTSCTSILCTWAKVTSDSQTRLRVSRRKSNVSIFNNSPWYNCHGWLGVKNQLTIYLSSLTKLFQYSQKNLIKGKKKPNPVKWAQAKWKRKQKHIGHKKGIHLHWYNIQVHIKMHLTYQSIQPIKHYISGIIQTSLSLSVTHTLISNTIYSYGGSLVKKQNRRLEVSFEEIFQGLSKCLRVKMAVTMEDQLT